MQNLLDQFKRTVRYSMAAILGISALASNAQVKMHTIGDSTMQTYDESSTDKRGWAQMLQQFFDVNAIKVNNRGKSGASSKSFYLENAYWPTLNGGSDCIKAGDFVLIQFAHNDEKTAGTDGDELKAYYEAKGDATSVASVDYRGTTPFDSYKKYLRMYIEDTKKLGAKPILVGPICRKYFNGNSLKRSGRHDLGDKFNVIEGGELKTAKSIPVDDHTMDYVYQMKQVAAEYDDVPFVDLTSATADMYLSYGESFCTNNLFCKDDSTHPAAMGATLIARLFAQLVKTQAEGGEADPVKRSVLQDLAFSVIITSDINFAPSTGDLGKTYLGQSVVKEFNISAFGVTPSVGEFVFTATGDVTISSDKTTYAQTTTIAYSGSTLIAPVYIKIDADRAGTLGGTVTVSNGKIKKSIDITLESISISGGTSVSVVWPLTDDANPVVTGPITPIDELFSGCYAKSYASVNKAAVWPENSGYDVSHKTQRVCIEGDSWPDGEIDEVSTRYVQFGVKAPTDTEIAINNISLYVAGAGGSGMRCKIYYSTDPTFSANTQIVEMKTMAGNNVYEITAQPTVSISDGQALYLRIYPWYSSSATGKTICFSDVTISGVSVGGNISPSSLSDELQSDVVDVNYFDISGKAISQPTRGLNIVRTKMSDGTITSSMRIIK